MRHRVAGRKLGRTSEHRLALLRNLSTALFDKEKITTTLAKAKELRPFAERLVTLSKKETLHARRRVMRHIHSDTVVAKLFDTLSARYAQRPGGYTRIVKLGPRRGDHAEMALIELVGSEVEKPAAEEKGKKAADGEPKAAAAKPKKKATKKRPAKKATKKAAAKPKSKKTAGKEEGEGGTASKAAKKGAKKTTKKVTKKTAKKATKKTAKKAKSASKKKG